MAEAQKVVWSTNKDDYVLGDVIGSGATSIVQRAQYVPTDEPVAIKRINLGECNNSVEELLKEIQAMSQCQHENVVQYYTSFVVKEELWVIMQLCEHGSLLDIIKYRIKTSSTKTGVLDEQTIATVLKEVLKGLDYFHSNGQIHRDIKAGNILLAKDGTVRIADFGVSAWLAVGKDQSRDAVRHTFVGTPCWMAPEVMEQVTGYDYKADIWSFGITAIELATGTAPYHKYPPMKVLMLTLQNDPPTLDSAANDESQYKAYGKTLRKMIVQCLKKDPNERPTAKELLKHDFFTRKARDKAYLLKALYSDTGNALTSQKVKRVPGSSGRLHKTADGNWEWSDDDMDSERWDTITSKPEGEADTNTEQPQGPEGIEAQNNRTPRVEEANNLAKQVRDNLSIESKEPNGDVAKPAAKPAAKPEGSADGVGQELHLVLRLRNDNKELHDIKFDFTIGKDTSQSVSEELVEAGLVNGLDRIVMAANLDKIIERREKLIIFRLNSGVGQNEAPCDKSLLGFAQLTLS